jgi:hypothetical protein
LLLITLAALSEISTVISFPSSSTRGFCSTVVAQEQAEAEKCRPWQSRVDLTKEGEDVGEGANEDFSANTRLWSLPALK